MPHPARVIRVAWRAAEVRGDLLGPFERRIKGPRPWHRHVRSGLRRAPDVVEFQLIRNRNLDALEGSYVEGRAEGRALGARAIVAADVAAAKAGIRAVDEANRKAKRAAENAV